MGRILGKWRDLHGESFALSARESQTRTRGSITTTISSACPANQHGSATRLHTQSRGTPMDTGDSRGTGLRIIHIVTSTGGRGSIFPTTKKRGSGFSPPQKFSKGGLHATLPPITPHEVYIPVLAHFRSQAPNPHPVFPNGNLPSCHSPRTLRLPPRASARAFGTRHANLWVALYLRLTYGSCGWDRTNDLVINSHPLCL